MLELKNITKRFGSVLANDNVSLKVEKGTIHAIVGENGAGKSTIMRIAYGFYTADSGNILVDEKPADIRSPHEAIALGIGMVHQHFMLVDDMTVAENIILGAETGTAFDLDLNKAREEIAKLSADLALGVDPAATVGDLSVGQQQRVELLKALYRNARLLILDEPTAVLSPPEVDELFDILRRMKARGETIIIITHKLEEVMAISDFVTVMRDGRTVGTLRTSETDTKSLVRMIVGRDVLLRVEKSDANAGDTVLEVININAGSATHDAVIDISLTVRRGEIVGIAGIEGNGQTELIEAIASLRPISSGSIRFEGSDITNVGARRLKELGVAHIPEDRHRRGLLLNADLAENSILGVHYRRPISASGFLDSAEIDRRVNEIIRNFDVRPPVASLPARALSGGNQQKLIVGREFELEPKLMLVAQPTRGVDIGAIEFIHRKLIELRDAGCAILLVSAELEEVMALADRVLVIRRGRIVGEFDSKLANAAEIGELMTFGD